MRMILSRAAGVTAEAHTVGTTVALLLVVGLGDVIGPLLGARETVLPHSPWNLFASEHTFQVLLRNWINTLAMLAAIASLVVLVLSRRPDDGSAGPRRAGERVGEVA
jgi:hypothetical protein